MSKLGKSNDPSKLAWLTKPGTPLSELPVVEAPDQLPPHTPSTPSKPAKPLPEPEPVEELVQLNLRVPLDLAKRFYSEVAFDAERRTLQEVGTEILGEALAKRPDKGPAPPSYLKRLKSYGKRKKS